MSKNNQITIQNQLSTLSLDSGFKINQSQGMVLGFLALSLMALVAVQYFGDKKSKLAQGRFGGTREKAKAKQKALAQMKKREKDAVSVWIGRPQPNPLSQEKPIYLPDAQRGIAVFGAPGTGKTVSIIDQVALSVFDQGFPTIVWDFKYPTQTSRLAPYAAKCGYDVKVFAPGFPESERCNPLDFLADERDSLMARQLAEVINANFKKIGHGSEDGFFGPAGDQVTEGILMLAKGTKYPDLMMAQALVSRTDLAGQLLQKRNELDPWILASFGQLLASAKSEKTVSSILATAANNLTRLMKPELVPALIGSSTIPTRLRGKQLLILGLDREKRDVLAPLIATVLHLLVNQNVTNRQDPLFLIADEVPTLYLPSLHHWLNENREDGLCTLLGFQNIVQMDQIYGKELSRAIVGACGTKVIFNPQDLETAKMFSEYLGEKEIKYKQKSQGRSGGKANNSTSVQIQTQPLWAPSEFLGLPTGRCLMVNPHFSQGKNAYIPLLESIKLHQDYQEIINWSQKCWPEMKPKLIERSPAKLITDQDLEARYHEVEKIFPQLEGKKEPWFV
jgi:type IV secretory pathway TraG/TraD family ATPase VirD4